MSALNGTWKRVKIDNGPAFGKAIGASAEQLANSAKAVSTVTYTISGNSVKVNRKHVVGDRTIVSEYANLSQSLLF